MYKFCFNYNNWIEFQEMEIIDQCIKYIVLIFCLICVGTDFEIPKKNKLYAFNSNPLI